MGNLTSPDDGDDDDDDFDDDDDYDYDDDDDNQCVDDHCDCDDNDVVENRRWVQATQSQTSHPITDPAVEARAKRYVIVILFLTAQEGCHYHRHHPPLL